MRRAVILAAGQGKRMRGSLPKVLHEVAGRSMLWHIMRELRLVGVDEIVLVASAALAAHLDDALKSDVRLVIQEQARGTGHAVQVALAQLEPVADGHLLIASGDMPLLDAALFARIFDALGNEHAMALATARMGSASNFGRIERNAGGDVERIVEVRDCTAEQRALEEMNAGLYAFAESALRRVIVDLKSDNAQQEYYLTDTLELLRAAAQRTVAVQVDDCRSVLGVNDRVELAQAHAAMNARLCEQYMRAGVTIIDPTSTYLEPELEIGVDTVIYPNSSIGRLSVIGACAVIGPNTRLSNARIGDNSEIRESVVVDSQVGADCKIGPYAHLRMQTQVADDVRVGNFVELKNATMAKGVRAGHLSYLGDAEVGEAVNIGAGTITCNYDGVKKHHTVIGARSFIGSNSSLIAPLRIGEDALTGAGAVVTRDVEDGARVVGNPAKPLATRKGDPAWH